MTAAREFKCAVCGSDFTPKRPEYRLYDDRYGFPGTFELVTCPECRHSQLEPQLPPESLTDLYSRYYPRAKMDADAPGDVKAEPSVAYFWVPPRVRVLDIGCGFGESLAYLTARGCEAYGVEADTNVGPVAQKHGYRIHVGLFRGDIYEEAFFDYVTLNQVIEHMNDPVRTLREIHRILKPGGRLILTTPNRNGWGARVFGHRWINWHAPYHSQFFSRKSLKLAAERSGFVVEEVKTVTSGEWLYYQWIHLCFFPEVTKPSIFWSMSPNRDFFQKCLFKALHLVHRMGINRLVTKAFDTAGTGDNFVIILQSR